MSAILPGYNYDIFISYRQKDNKHDGWVTEFVENLKDELESTFKEEISVYFDINPHDGLLETHDVDASLKEKLKCLIFIPIISRTYCDPKSFAWEHEFKAFVEMASKDQFGLKVKLPNGNVASRVLPVRIHDLDKKDIIQCEEVLGGNMRGIEFIYREPGVNKPLQKDNPKYSIQINKVANAIRELIMSLDQGNGSFDDTGKLKHERKQSAARKKKILLPALAAIVLIISAVLLFPSIIPQRAHFEKSIAVLPFKVLNDDPEIQYMADNIMEQIIENLCNLKALQVVQGTEKFRSTNEVPDVIGKELKVNYLIDGAFQELDHQITVIIHLKDAKEGRIRWIGKYNRDIKEIIPIPGEIVKNIADKLNIGVSSEEKNIIGKIPTVNLAAWDLYMRGKDELRKFRKTRSMENMKKSVDSFNSALALDSNLAEAYVGLALNIYSRIDVTLLPESARDSALMYLDTALKLDEKLASAHSLKASFFISEGKISDALNECETTLRYNPNDPEAYDNLSAIYSDLGVQIDYVKAISYEQKALSLSAGEVTKNFLNNLGGLYTNYAGFYNTGVSYYQRAYELEGDTLALIRRVAIADLFSGYFTDAKRRFEWLIASDTLSNTDYYFKVQSLILAGLCDMYLGNNGEALEKFRKNISYVKEKNDSVYVPIAHRIGYAYKLNGIDDSANYWFDMHLRQTTDNMIKIKDLNAQNGTAYYDIAANYAFNGRRKEAYENLRELNKLKVISSMLVTLLKYDPMFKTIKDEPEFQQILNEIESKYQSEHERVRKWLEENNML